MILSGCSYFRGFLGGCPLNPYLTVSCDAWRVLVDHGVRRIRQHVTWCHKLLVSNTLTCIHQDFLEKQTTHHNTQYGIEVINGI